MNIENSGVSKKKFQSACESVVGCEFLLLVQKSKGRFALHVVFIGLHVLIWDFAERKFQSNIFSFCDLFALVQLSHHYMTCLFSSLGLCLVHMPMIMIKQICVWVVSIWAWASAARCTRSCSNGYNSDTTVLYLGHLSTVLNNLFLNFLTSRILWSLFDSYSCIRRYSIHLILCIIIYEAFHADINWTKRVPNLDQPLYPPSLQSPPVSIFLRA